VNDAWVVAYRIDSMFGSSVPGMKSIFSRINIFSEEPELLLGFCSSLLIEVGFLRLIGTECCL